MKGLLFFLGCALIAITMGVPDDMLAKGNSAKSALPYLVYWLLSPLLHIGGKYLVVLFGVVMLIVAFLLPKKKHDK